VDSTELKGLLTGALPPLSSRMRFHYDFLLKHRLTGGKLPIAEQSYWATQQREVRAGIDIEIALAKQAVEAAPASDAELTLIGEFDRLTDAIVGKKNAPQRKAQAALNSWLDGNGGPVFNNAKIRVARLRDAIAKRDRLIADAAAWDATPLLCLEPQEACLKDWGFFAEGDTGLTPLGIAATEVNEGHAILMPMLAFSDRAAGLTGEEIACVIAAFLNESRVENPPTLASSGLRREVIDILHWSHDTVTDCQRTEAKHGVVEPSESFWALSSLWVCITARWVAGAGLNELATEFELFEGNIQRGLMRIANLLEEWGAIATLRCDLATLEKLSGLRFLRDEVIVDSLYLRL
jgi:hypothetical protein